jgi:fructose-1,6-bisphosphatase/inositol monophosphatase family enzyme
LTASVSPHTTPDPAAVLAVAARVARAAGERLRAELHRPGGPRGERGHAPIDAEVEDEIRAALSAAFPLDGVRGEERPELDTSAQAGGGTWLVDPNDGTGPFLNRQRGASVSIGRVVDGVPVLGVVYAYAWPDDRGTFLAWAEGAGPLTVNGEAVPEGPLPPIWWVSNSAERKATALAQAVSAQQPEARFAPGPGIAFRLAQVAAGCGELAVSVFAPRDFDVAGGHALVRGAGAEMVDARQRTQTYRADRPTRAASVFAGAGPITARGAATTWAELVRAPEDPVHVLGPLPAGGWPLVRDAERLSRAQGAWMGLLVGDAQGAAYAGQLSDAGADALAFARALVLNRPLDPPGDTGSPLRGIALGLWSLGQSDGLKRANTAAQATVAAMVRQAVITGSVDLTELRIVLGKAGFEPDLDIFAMVDAEDARKPALSKAIFGAQRGLASLPLHDRLNTLTCRPIAGLPGVTHPVPATHWPTDALVLAERLMLPPGAR